MKNTNVRVIFIDNGDGLLITENYSHIYDNMKQMVDDYKLILSGEDTSDWDNNELDNDNFNVEDYNNSVGVYEWDGKSAIDIEFGYNSESFAELLKKEN